MMDRTDEDRAEQTIRRDERMRLAALLEKSASTIGSFAVDTEGAVKLVAFMLRLDQRA